MALGRTACLLLAAAALASPAAAQPPAGRPGGAEPSEHGGRWRERMEARDAREAADVALLLRLRPDQQGAYQAWAQAMRPPMGGPGRHERAGGERDDAPPSTTPQALDKMQAMMTTHEADASARLDATRRFYAALSPDQQALFDALMRLRRGRLGAEGGMHGLEGRPGWSGGPGGGSPPPPPEG